MGFIFWIIVGAVAGWIAEKVMNANHGILTNIVLGIIGAQVGGWLFNILGVNQFGGNGWIGSIITAAIGAIILIWLYRAIRGRR